MNSDPSFLNLARGNRPKGYMGLVLAPEEQLVFGPDYSYIQISKFVTLNGSDIVEGKLTRNQHIEFVPNVTLTPVKGYKVLVKTNPLLQSVGSCPALFMLDYGDDTNPVFYVTLRKDFDSTQLDWIVRLYLIS